MLLVATMVWPSFPVTSSAVPSSVVPSSGPGGAVLALAGFGTDATTGGVKTVLRGRVPTRGTGRFVVLQRRAGLGDVDQAWRVVARRVSDGRGRVELVSTRLGDADYRIRAPRTADLRAVRSPVLAVPFRPNGPLDGTLTPVPGDSRAADAVLSGDGRVLVHAEPRPDPSGEEATWLFRTDLDTGEQRRVRPEVDGDVDRWHFRTPLLSDDGRWLVVEASPPYVVEQPWEPVGLLRVDLLTGATTPVRSAAHDLRRLLAEDLSGDGRTLVGLLPFSEGSQAVAVDLADGDVRFLSRTAAGEPVDAGDATISADGAVVAFIAYGDGVVPGDLDGRPDLFHVELDTGRVQQVTAEAPEGADDYLAAPHLSADGRHLAFADLEGVKVWDAETGRETLVSVDHRGADFDLGEPAGVSADGSRVLFSGCPPGGDGEAQFQVFVRDLRAGASTRLSVAPDHRGAPNNAGAAALSDDGRTALLSTRSPRLLGVDGPSTPTGLYVWRQRGTA